MSNTTQFEKFQYLAPQYQRELVAILVQLPDAYNNNPSLWSPGYFDEYEHICIVTQFLKLRAECSDHPTKETMLAMYMQEEHGKNFKVAVTAADQKFMNELDIVYSQALYNVEHHLNQLKTFGKYKGMSNAMHGAIDELQQGKFEGVKRAIDDAYYAGESSSLAEDSFYTEPPHLGEVIIPDVMRMDHLGMINAHPKSYKTWTVIQLAICVAFGKPWLNKFQAGPAHRVLYVNMECPEEEFKVRLDLVAEAMGTSRADLLDKVDFLNREGMDNSVDKVVAAIHNAHHKNSPWGLIIIDPTYHLTATNGDTTENIENNNAFIGGVFRKLRAMKNEIGAPAIVLVHHFKKGNAADTMTVDSGAGAGTFGRAPSFIFAIKPLRNEDGDAITDCFCVETVLNYFKGIEDFGVRMNFPLMQHDSLLDTENLAGKKGRPAKHTRVQVLRELGNDELTNQEWLKRCKSEYGMRPDKFKEFRDELLDDELVESSGTNTRMHNNTFHITEAGKLSLGTHNSALRGLAALKKNGNNGDN